MAETTNIEWTDHTFNTHWGCSKVSPGCDRCYAERLAARFGYGWGDDAAKREFGESHWNDLLRWDRKAAAEGVRRQVFTNSMSDLFDKFAPAGVRERHFPFIDRTSNLDHLLLTKRIGNVARMVPPHWLQGGWPANAFLGISVVNQEEADRDIPKLLALPARVRFLSIEPMLGPIDLQQWTLAEHGRRQIGAQAGIGWVIAGGESGPHARPMHPAWARGLRDQCAAAGVPFLFKQWGEWLSVDQMNDEFMNRLYKPNRVARLHQDQDALNESYGRRCIVPQGVLQADGALVDIATPMAFRIGLGSMLIFNVGKKAAGRLLDGVEHNGFPEVRNG